MYYTNEHEWIDYRGHTAHIGICKNKLSGISEIQRITFCEVPSNIERGSVIVTFHSERKSFEVYMPVDGKIIGFINKLIENPSMILSKGRKVSGSLRSAPTRLTKERAYCKNINTNYYSKK